MKKSTTMAALFGCLFFMASCDPQPNDSETVIIKENSTEEPVIIEDNTDNDVDEPVEEEGVDIELGTNDEGKVDVNIEGRVKDDN